MTDNLINGVRLVGQVGEVTVVLLPLAEVAQKHGYAESYIKRLCQERVLIAIKYPRDWFVEENLSRIGSLTTLPKKA